MPKADNLASTQANTKDLLSFFLPLAISSMMMMGSHSIISSAMARTSNAAAALAAYSVAQSISILFESPCFNIRRMAVALFNDKMSYASVKKVSLWLLAGLTAAMALIAFGPLGRPVFLGLVGIPEELFPDVISVFRVFIIFPSLSVLRSFYQGLIIVRRKTYFLTINMVIRLSMMLLVAGLLPNLATVPGSVIGGLLLVFGIGTEAILAMVVARTWKKHLPDEPTSNQGSVSPLLAFRFYLPLAAAALLETFGRPIINAGLARTSSPELALAGYQIAHTFAWIFIAIAYNIHQVVIVFGNDASSFAKVKRFAWLVGIGTSILLFALTFSGGTEWIMLNIIGVQSDIVQTALYNVIILAIMPLTLSLSELYAGLLIAGRQTPSVTIAKVANVVGIALASLTIAAYLPNLAPYLAGISMVTGSLLEGLVSLWRAKVTVLRADENLLTAWSVSKAS